MKSILLLILVFITVASACLIDEDCGGIEQGKCVNATCYCLKRYADVDCGYRRKDKLTVFLISFFAGGTGADRFILGYIGLGVGKLILAFSPCVMSCGLICLAAVLKDSGFAVYGIYLCIMIMAYLAAFAWWLADWILIITGDMKDVNGYSLFDNM